MTEQVHIAHWILDLGLGGDAKNLVALAQEQAKWARVSVLTQCKDPGPRVAELQAVGISVMADIVPDMVSHIVANMVPDIVIVHRNGAPNSVEALVLDAFVVAGVPCVEYNTFARVDTTTDHLWTAHGHLSRASFLQYARRRGVSVFDLPNQAAVGYAVAIPPAILEEEKRQARRSLKISDGAYVVSRIMRADLRKWDPMPVLAIERLLRRGVKVELVIQSAPAERHNWLRSLLGQSVKLLEPTVSESDLRQTFSASDCVVNYSAIGETFGLGLAEAMAVGLPVVVNSTPKVDNAQIELCRHNERGLVANTVSSLAGALEYLSQHPDSAQQFGCNARQFMIETFAPPVVEARLRRLIRQCLAADEDSAVASKIPQPDLQDDSYVLNPQWVAEYEESERETFSGSTSKVEDLVDSLYLNFLRLEDMNLYARSIGLAGIVEKVKRRLSQGSILRG